MHAFKKVFVFPAQDWYVKDGWIIFLSYLDSLLVKEVEYLVYDFNGIVAAVGGGLGLFLGFSVFSVAMKSISLVFSSRGDSVNPEIPNNNKTEVKSAPAEAF